MKKTILFSLITLWACVGFGQNTFKITGNNMKVMGTTHIVLNNTDFINQGNLDVSTASISFTGSSSNTLASGGATLYHIKINKSSGQSVSLTEDADISHQLEFLSDNNTLKIASSDLEMGASATIVGTSTNRFVVTASTGRLVKSSMNTFTFPVGFDASTYNPLTLTENGTIDNIGVRCLENVLESGTSGSPITTGVAEASWELSEDVAGGSTLAVTAQWATADELSGFDRTDSGIMRYLNGIWDLPVTAMGAASGSNPYTQTGTVSEMGVIAVGGEARINRVKLAIRAFLQGPYQGAQMTDNLRSQSLIPLTEPFTTLGYSHQGRGGNETTTGAVLALTGNDVITDWVFIELRDATDPTTVLATTSALIQRDGDIVDLDGISDVGMPVVDADYFIAIRHRNHLGVRTPVAESLSKSSTAIYDFTTSLGSAWDNSSITSNDALFDNNGVFMLIRADGNGNNFINVVDFILAKNASTPNQASVYTGFDINMDGNINVVDFIVTKNGTTPNQLGHLD